MRVFHWRPPLTSATTTTSFPKDRTADRHRKVAYEKWTNKKRERLLWRDNKNRFNIVPIKLWITFYRMYLVGACTSCHFECCLCAAFASPSNSSTFVSISHRSYTSVCRVPVCHVFARAIHHPCAFQFCTGCSMLATVSLLYLPIYTVFRLSYLLLYFRLFHPLNICVSASARYAIRYPCRASAAAWLEI